MKRLAIFGMSLFFVAASFTSCREQEEQTREEALIEDMQEEGAEIEKKVDGDETKIKMETETKKVKIKKEDGESKIKVKTDNDGK